MNIWIAFVMQGNKCAMIAKITEANKVLNRRLMRLPSYDEVAGKLKAENVSTVRLVSQSSNFTAAGSLHALKTLLIT